MKIASHIDSSAALILAVLWTCSAAFATEPITITASVNNDTVRVGDIIKYSVVVKWSPELDLQDVSLADTFGVFHLIKTYPPVDSRTSEGDLKRIYTYDLMAFETGEHDIPPFIVRYKGSDNEEKTASSVPVKVTVQSLLPANEENLRPRPLKPPVEIPPDYTHLYLLSAAIAAFLIIALITWYVWRRFLRKKGVEEEIAHELLEPPEKVALEHLHALETSDLLRKGKIKEYFSEAADIIRIYLGRRFGVNAVDMTSFELVYALRSSGHSLLNEEIVGIIENFLSECDMVKFAKFIPSEERQEKIVADARSIVLMTTPEKESTTVSMETA